MVVILALLLALAGCAAKKPVETAPIVRFACLGEIVCRGTFCVCGPPGMEPPQVGAERMDMSGRGEID